MSQQNNAAALESANWVVNQLGQGSDFQTIIGFLHLREGDYVKARQAFEITEPRYWKRESWRAAIEKDSSLGCLIATTMV